LIYDRITVVAELVRLVDVLGLTVDELAIEAGVHARVLRRALDGDGTGIPFGDFRRIREWVEAAVAKTGRVMPKGGSQPIPIRKPRRENPDSVPAPPTTRDVTIGAIDRLWVAISNQAKEIAELRRRVAILEGRSEN